MNDKQQPAPERIWIQMKGFNREYKQGAYSAERLEDTDTQYVRADLLQRVPDEKQLAEIRERAALTCHSLTALVRSGNVDELESRIVAALTLLQQPPAAGERCRGCGHNSGLRDGGLCAEVVLKPNAATDWKEVYCPHRCDFPVTGATTEHEEAIHWRLKAGVEETVCGLEVADVQTTLLPDVATCDKCKVGFFGYKMGRAAATTGAAESGEREGLLRDAGAILCVNDPDAGARVEIRFGELEDAQRLHKALTQMRANSPAATAEEERCGAFKPSVLGVPEPQDRCTKPAGHEGKHTLAPTAATADAAAQDDVENLHLAICQAVHLMNQGNLHAGHDLLRQTLIDFADRKTPLSRSEIVRRQQRSGGREVTTVMVSAKENSDE